MATWTLLYGGVEKSLADWKLSNLKRRQSSQSDYQVTFTAPSARFDSTPVFAYGQTVTIKRNGVKWFVGPVVSIPSQGSEQSESVDYVVASPWWYLENIPFQQEWAQYNGSTYTKARCTHVFLGQMVSWPAEVTPHETPPRYSGDPVTVYAGTDGAIKEVLDWAILCAPSKFTYDTSIPSVVIPIDECRDITCADAIKRVCKWLRDVVVWWDFTTTLPTLRFQRKASLTTATLTVGSKPLKSFQVQPRYDLQVNFVKLIFEQMAEISGVQQLTITEDRWPVSGGSEVGGMTVTIDLKGAVTNYVEGFIKARACNPASADWWALRHPWIETGSGKLISTITISDVERQSGYGSYPNDVTGGQCAEWMGVLYRNETIKAKAKITYNDGTIKNENLTTQITVTNAPCGTGGSERRTDYSTLSTFESGDIVPTGLARSVYESLETLQYSGTITLQEAEAGDWLAAQSITTATGLGLCIKIAGTANSNLYSIGTMVQSCDEDCTTGMTTLTVGPPEQLAVQELITLLQITRNRVRWNNPATRTLGPEANPGRTQYADDQARESSNSTVSKWEKQIISGTAGALPITFDSTGSRPVIKAENGSVKATVKDGYLKLETGSRYILIDASTIGYDIEMREYDICVAGVQKKVLLLGSVAYTP